MFPYLIPHGIEGLQFRVHNDEARAWYDPLRPYTLLEYEWVRENVHLAGEVVIDAGCHHGNYSVVFRPAYIIGVDCIDDCVRFAADNMILNEMYYEVHQKMLGEQGVETPWRVGIYKMDIEGAEFQLLPAEMHRHAAVHTWIVEIHPRKGDPQRIARDFIGAGYELLKVDREQMEVRRYVLGEPWPGHSTLIARKP